MYAIVTLWLSCVLILSHSWHCYFGFLLSKTQLLLRQMLKQVFWIRNLYRGRYHYLSCCSCCWGDDQKSPRLHRFRSDLYEIWHYRSSTKYPLIDGIGFLIWPYTIKIVSIMSIRPYWICNSICCLPASPWSMCDVIISLYAL